MVTFGKRLKQLRNNKGLTQQELADLFYLDKSSISKYENDKNVPENKLLIELADYFEVTVDFILGRTDDILLSRDINSDIYAEHDFDEELRDLLKDEDMAAFYDYANLDAGSKKEIIEFIKFKKEQEANKKNLFKNKVIKNNREKTLLNSVFYRIKPI